MGSQVVRPENEWVDVPENEWADALTSPPPAPAAEAAEEGPVSRFVQGAAVEPMRGIKDTLAELFKYGSSAEGARELLTPGVAPFKLVKKIMEGLQAGSQDQFTKMFEQYDQGGLNERGADGSLSPVGRGIAAVVPGVGPYAAGLVDRGASGDVAGAAGSLTTAVGLNEAARFIPKEIRAGRAAKAEEASHLARRTAREGEAEINATVEARAQVARDAQETANRGYVEQAEKLRKVRRDNMPTDVQQVNSAIAAQPKDYAGGRDPARAVLRNVSNDPEQIAAMAPDDLVSKLEQAMQGHQRAAATQIAQPRSVTTNQTAGMILDGTLQPLVTKLEGRELTKLAKVVKGHTTELKTLLGKMGPDLQPTDVSNLIAKIDDMTGLLGQSKRTAPLRNALGDIRKAYTAELYAGDSVLAGAKSELRNLPGAKRGALRRGLEQRASHGPKQVKEPGFEPAPDPELPLTGPIREGMIGFPPPEVPTSMGHEVITALRSVGNLPLYGGTATPIRAGARSLAYLLDVLGLNK